MNLNRLSMMPVLKKAIILGVASIIAITAPSYALGLGSIKVKAAHNKRFKAIIPISLSRGESKVTARVGSPLEYKTLQVERPEFVDNFKVRVIRNPDRSGGKLLEVSSSKGFKQPSFNLVISATSEGGTILENFFLVMDFRKSLSLDLPKDTTAEKKDDKKPEVVTLNSVKDSEKKPAASTGNDRLMALLNENKVKSTPLTVAPKVDEDMPPEVMKRLKEEKVAALPTSTIVPVAKIVIVKSGDTLYGIVEQLGFPKKERLKVALAIYQQNKAAFFRENIDWLKVGAKLYMDKIGDSISRLTNSDVNAKFFLPAKQKTDSVYPAPIVGPLKMELPIAEHISSQKVIAFVQKWKKHWVNKDKEELGSDYASDFKDPWKRGKKLFLKKRFAFNSNKENIKIDLEDISLVRNGPYVTVYFTQWFRSESYASVGLKRLKIKRTTAGLKIASEEFTPNRAAGGGHSWLVYISYSKDIEMAKSHIESLRAGGFEAFEAESFRNIKGKGYRVLIGRASNKRLAQKISNEVKGSGKRFAKVLRLPFAFEAGSFDNRRDALLLFEEMRKQGYSPYMLEALKDGKPRFSVYHGAFATEELAITALATIRDKDFKFKIVTP